jgi:DNA-binding NtrC family response regulator
MSRILIIDDEKAIRRTLKEILEYENHITDEAENGSDALNMIKNGKNYDLVLCDIKMPKIDGVETLVRARELARIPFIMISGHGDIETAVECMKKGAVDYIEKPLDLNRLLTTINNILSKHNQPEPEKEVIVKQNKSAIPVSKSGVTPTLLIGKSQVMVAMRNLIEKIAPTDARVLITGENGSGKELVAKMLFEKSLRNNMPFVEINCAAIPNELIESELFGHVKGSFTSAIKDRKGKFEQADGGTLFLDEVGDMNLSAQSKVLRVLQEKKICRVGSEKDISVDVRIIAATNKNLRQEIEKGNFREDLYHRLCVIEIQVPPLNERLEDIPLFIEHFLSQKSVKIETKAIEALKKFNYSGNVRQLQNIVERLAILCEGKITLEDVKKYAL